MATAGQPQPKGIIFPFYANLSPLDNFILMLF